MGVELSAEENRQIMREVGIFMVLMVILVLGLVGGIVLYKEYAKFNEMMYNGNVCEPVPWAGDHAYRCQEVGEEIVCYINMDYLGEDSILCVYPERHP